MSEIAISNEEVPPIIEGIISAMDKEDRSIDEKKACNAKALDARKQIEGEKEEIEPRRQVQ